VFCQSCGKELVEKAKFCGNCGTRTSGNYAATEPSHLQPGPPIALSTLTTLSATSSIFKSPAVIALATFVIGVCFVILFKESSTNRILDILQYAIFPLVAASAVWVYLDASLNKIGKIEGDKSFLNMSPGDLAGATLLLWVVCFPMYLYRRKSLIKQANESPSNPGGHIMFGVCFVIFLGIFAETTWQSALPSCDSDDALHSAGELIDNNPVLRSMGVDGNIKNPAEDSYKDGRRVCKGFIKSHSGSDIPLTYNVSWHDKSKGIFRVQIGE